ncbi:hypothetical protein QFC21_004892 [Naganishia friedmannii]|uniref:Uncharacterized protein n=1 Tax=Naganishia friedmannii TaxID=89922 RepID=A0ACC2VCW3_9TREE|nr:hypothetical protein QFC21_004892 [Naganishia friedmannii]
MTNAGVERQSTDAQQQSNTSESQKGDKVLDGRQPSPSPSDLKALNISIPPRRKSSGSSSPVTSGERDEHRVADRAAEVGKPEDVDETDARTAIPQLSVRSEQRLARRTSSIPYPPASPTFPPIINGHAHPTPSWLPRPSLAEPGVSSSTIISPASRSTTPSLATAPHQQTHLHYEYQESPRSPLAWRQTFGEAVRLNTGGAVSPALPYTPIPAPAPERTSPSSRQGSVGAPPEGYFTFASRSGSVAGLDEQGQAFSPGNAVANDDGAAFPSGGWKERIAVTFGPIPIRNAADSTFRDSSGAVSPSQLEREAGTELVREDAEQLRGLGFDTPISYSRPASPSPFESVSLHSSGSERPDDEEEQDEGQGQLSPLPPSSVRSKSFSTRSSLGSTNAAGLEPTTPRQRQPSSRRVSASSLTTTTTHQRSITKSPGSRRVSAGGGLWGDVETENVTRESSMSPRRRDDGVRSPLPAFGDGIAHDAASSSSTMTSIPLSRAPSTTSSRRPSGASVVRVGNGSTPTAPTTPRLQAPPAIPHDLDRGILAKLSRPGASSMALWAEKGDPVAVTVARVAEEESRKKRLSLRTSADSVSRVSMSGEAMGAPTSTPSMTSSDAAGGQQRVVGSTHPSSGPSKLDQVRSQTRMVHLPPKSREEDAVHLERWKEMMEQSRVADENRQAEREYRRLEMERRLAADMPVWETEVLNPAMAGAQAGGDAWSSRIRGNPKLRDMWFRGVPSHLRGRAWSLAIGNDLTLSKDAFRQYHSRARKAIQSERFPQDILDAIEHDTSETLRVIKLFQAGSPMHDELKDLLHAWSCLRAFYSGITDEVEAYYRIFETLQGELFPKIYANCKHLGVRLPSSYFTTVFIHQLSFEAAARVWDVILLEGDSHIFRIALAILAILEPRLYFPDRKEITSILEGSNPASLAIVARERERAKQKGLPFVADIDGVLTSLGVTEDAIFDTLQHDDWKESRFNRLCQRELPDD